MTYPRSDLDRVMVCADARLRQQMPSVKRHAPRSGVLTSIGRAGAWGIVCGIVAGLLVIWTW